MKKGLIIPLLSLIAITVVGTIGFHYIEGVGFSKSVYWTIVTITTVGYGDITPQTEMGRIFAIGLMIVGIGAILYTLTAVGRNIIEGRIWEIFTMQEKKEEVQKLENHLIICGYGDIGRTVTQQLQLGNEDIVIIDEDAETLREEATDLFYIIGDGTKEEILEDANIQKARGLFATLPSDSDNILLTLSAKDLNSDIRIIAKADSTEGAKHLKRAGVEAVVLPEQEGGIRMARSFLHPEVTSLYDHLLRGDVGRAGAVTVEPKSKLAGKTIKESKIKSEIGVSIIGIKRGDDIITNPKIDEKIKDRDTLIVMGTLSQIRKLRNWLSEKE